MCDALTSHIEVKASQIVVGGDRRFPTRAVCDHRELGVGPAVRDRLGADVSSMES